MNAIGIEQEKLTKFLKGFKNVYVIYLMTVWYVSLLTFSFTRHSVDELNFTFIYYALSLWNGMLGLMTEK